MQLRHVSVSFSAPAEERASRENRKLRMPRERGHVCSLNSKRTSNLSVVDRVYEKMYTFSIPQAAATFTVIRLSRGQNETALHD